jgi:hypothetical protein
MGMIADTERHAIEHVAQRLSRHFPAVDPAVVRQVVQDIYHRFDAHPTREFVPILVEEAARDRLTVMPGHSRARPPAHSAARP